MRELNAMINALWCVGEQTVLFPVVISLPGLCSKDLIPLNNDEDQLSFIDSRMIRVEQK